MGSDLVVGSGCVRGRVFVRAARIVRGGGLFCDGGDCPGRLLIVLGTHLRMLRGGWHNPVFLRGQHFTLTLLYGIVVERPRESRVAVSGGRLRMEVVVWLGNRRSHIFCAGLTRWCLDIHSDWKVRQICVFVCQRISSETIWKRVITKIASSEVFVCTFLCPGLFWVFSSEAGCVSEKEFFGCWNSNWHLDLMFPCWEASAQIFLTGLRTVKGRCCCLLWNCRLSDWRWKVFGLWQRWTHFQTVRDSFCVPAPLSPSLPSFLRSLVSAPVQTPATVADQPARHPLSPVSRLVAASVFWIGGSNLGWGTLRKTFQLLHHRRLNRKILDN